MTLEEKLAFVRQLFQMSMADDVIKPVEYKFLYEVAVSMDIPLEKLEEMFESELQYKLPKENENNVIQIYRLALMMKVDKEISPEEINTLRSFALQLKQHPDAVDTMLRKMKDNKQGTISYEELLKIFNTQYN